LPFKGGVAAIAAAAERRLGSRIAIVPCGLSYTRNGSWKARLNVGRAVYLEDFGSRQMLVRYMEQRVVELSQLLAGGQGLVSAGQRGARGGRACPFPELADATQRARARGEDVTTTPTPIDPDMAGKP